MASAPTTASRWRALLASAVGLASGACTQQATEVIVIVDTDAPAARRFELTASVASGTSSTPMRHVWIRATGTPGAIDFPASFAIVPPASGSIDAPVILGLHVHVEPGAAGEPGVDFDRNARFSFVRHSTTVLRVFLSLRCGQAATGCTSVPDAQCTIAQRCTDMHQTCSNDAMCASVDVTPIALDRDDGGRIDVPSADAGPRMDVASDAPMDVQDTSPADTGPVDTGAEACSGACTPGQTRTNGCGNCGMRTDTCSSSCAWVNGTCTNQGACRPGDTRSNSCGPCATQTDTCDSSCNWVAGSCSGSCCTPMAGCASGNPIGALCAGNGDDGCGGPCTCNTANGEACNVGSGYGSCCHTNGWFCADQSECCPGLTCIGNICS